MCEKSENKNCENQCEDCTCKPVKKSIRWENRNRLVPRLVHADEVPSVKDEIPTEKIEVWVYHPQLMQQIGDNALVNGMVHKITKNGLERYV